MQSRVIMKSQTRKTIFKGITPISIATLILVTLFVARSFSFLRNDVILFSEKRASIDIYQHETIDVIIKNLGIDLLPNGASQSVFQLAKLKNESSSYAAAHPNSLTAAYQIASGSGQCNVHPYRPYLRAALQRLNPKRTHSAILKLRLQRKSSVLVFYDPKADINILGSAIIHLYNSSQFQNFFLMSSSCLRTESPKMSRFAAKLSDSVPRSLRLLFIKSRGIHSDMILIRQAKTVLVHGGSVAALAALCAERTVFFTELLDSYAEKNSFRWIVRDLKPIKETKWMKHRQYNDELNAMGSVQPTCCRFIAFGTGDGEKVVCGNGRNLKQKVGGNRREVTEVNFSSGGKAQCWILSLGCGGRWSFEESVAKHTDCFVQTFDCTGDFNVPKHLQDRVILHKLCVGSVNSQATNFKSWEEIINIGSVSSGLVEGTAPSLVKMDIEGWEFPVLKALLTETSDAKLPDQIVMELHIRTHLYIGDPWTQLGEKLFQVRRQDIERLYRMLHNKKYVLTHRADNPYCAHCTEVTLMRRDALPPE